MIHFGTTVKDLVTGFGGIVTGRASYITGCDQYLVQPKCEKENVASEGKWFDEQRLEYFGNAPRLELDNSNGNGADLAAPIK